MILTALRGNKLTHTRGRTVELGIRTTIEPTYIQSQRVTYVIIRSYPFIIKPILFSIRSDLLLITHIYIKFVQ